MNKTLKKITYVWAVIMAILIIALFLVGCGPADCFDQTKTTCGGGDIYFHNPHYEPVKYIPPPPEIDLDTLIDQATDPRFHFPE